MNPLRYPAAPSPTGRYVSAESERLAALLTGAGLSVTADQADALCLKGVTVRDPNSTS